MSPKLNYPICWRCGSKVGVRVNRPNLIKILLFWLPLKRYHCEKCHKKIYALYRQ